MRVSGATLGPESEGPRAAAEGRKAVDTVGATLIDLPQLGYWEEGVGDGDNDGCDNEMGDGDWDRVMGGLRAEAESSENL